MNEDKRHYGTIMAQSIFSGNAKADSALKELPPLPEVLYIKCF